MATEHVRAAIQLEQWLMEGAYNKVRVHLTVHAVHDSQTLCSVTVIAVHDLQHCHHIMLATCTRTIGLPINFKRGGRLQQEHVS